MPAPAEGQALPPFAPGAILARMPEGPRRAVGSALARLVREGMTLGRVRWLTGGHQPRLKPLPTAVLAGGGIIAFHDYSDYGVSITFWSGRGGVTRVAGVSPAPKWAAER